jgi:acyl dehydratase
MAAPPITRTTLALFAGASGDHNPIHIDLDVARSAGLEDVFAHGMLSMAYVARLVTDWVPQERVRGLSARFLSITPVHGQPTCTGTVTAVEDGVVTIDIAVTLADGTKTIEGQALVTAED